MNDTIVFDCERMKYPNTGLFTYCHQLGHRLARKMETDSIAFFTPPKTVGIFGERHTYLKQHSLQKFWLPSLHNYGLWHSTYQSSHYLPRRNSRIKVLLTIHDLNFMYDNRKSEAKKEKHLRFLQGNIRRSNAIVCISEFCKSDVLRLCDIGNRELTVIHNGTNSLPSPQLSHESYRPSSRFLFSIGVINRKKNFHVLLPLLKHNQDIELLIAGPADDPDYLHQIHERAEELGVSEQLRMLGPITEKEKSWYFSNCYAFTFPSLSEGFGLPVTEAMSVGKPLFLSDRTALPEIGRDVAFYFKDFNEDRMHHVFRSGMETYQRDDMAEKIKQRSEDFCWERAADQYIDVYRRLLAAQ